MTVFIEQELLVIRAMLDGDFPKQIDERRFHLRPHLLLGPVGRLGQLAGVDEGDRDLAVHEKRKSSYQLARGAKVAESLHTLRGFCVHPRMDRIHPGAMRLEPELPLC